MLSPKRARAPPAPETPPMSPSPSTLQAVPALALTTTFADLPNDCIIDILSFVGTPSSSPSAAGEAFRDLGRALCAAPWLRELGVHAWAAAVRRRWPAWAAIADAARVKRAVAEPSMGKAEEIAWRRQAELFELREREELAIAPLAGGAIAKRQTVVQPRHRAVLAEWLAEVRKVMERAIKSQIGRTDELGQREVERSRRASRGARASFCCSLRRRAWRFCERIAALEIGRDERHRAGAIRPRMRESCLLFSRSVRIKKLEDGEIAALTRTLAFASRFRSRKKTTQLLLLQVSWDWSCESTVIYRAVSYLDTYMASIGVEELGKYQVRKKEREVKTRTGRNDSTCLLQGERARFFSVSLSALSVWRAPLINGFSRAELPSFLPASPRRFRFSPVQTRGIDCLVSSGMAGTRREGKKGRAGRGPKKRLDLSWTQRGSERRESKANSFFFSSLASLPPLPSSTPRSRGTFLT